jgi:hypothetical protein
LEQVSVRPGDPFRPKQTRPNVIQAEAYEPKSSGITLLRYRHSRAATALEKGKAKRMDICLPFEASKEIIEKMDTHRKWTKLVLESIEDFEALMQNPDWLIKDKAEKIEMLVATMHARITTLKRTLE